MFVNFLIFVHSPYVNHTFFLKKGQEGLRKKEFRVDSERQKGVKHLCPRACNRDSQGSHFGEMNRKRGKTTPPPVEHTTQNTFLVHMAIKSRAFDATLLSQREIHILSLFFFVILVALNLFHSLNLEGWILGEIWAWKVCSKNKTCYLWKKNAIDFYSIKKILDH